MRKILWAMALTGTIGLAPVAAQAESHGYDTFLNFIADSCGSDADADVAQCNAISIMLMVSYMQIIRSHAEVCQSFDNPSPDTIRTGLVAAAEAAKKLDDSNAQIMLFMHLIYLPLIEGLPPKCAAKVISSKEVRDAYKATMDLAK